MIERGISNLRRDDFWNAFFLCWMYALIALVGVAAATASRGALLALLGVVVVGGAGLVIAHARLIHKLGDPR